MKGRAGVGGVAGTARLELGMGRIDSGRVFGHHSESRAVGTFQDKTYRKDRPFYEALELLGYYERIGNYA